MRKAEALADKRRIRGPLCRLAGISRQAVYQEEKNRTFRETEEEAIVESIKQARKVMPKLSVRKLHCVTKESLAEKTITIGRDKMYEIASKHGLIIKRRRKGTRTTQSGHRFPVYRNLIKEKAVTGPHQVLVKDITYVPIAGSRFTFLALVTDLYSRKIVGWNLGATLEAVGCMEALKMAIKQLPDGARPIVHSDRGVQYACREYVHLANERSLAISMTEENHCYENAVAERINGILKDEFAINDCFADAASARAAIREAIRIYNTWRPHLSLKMKTPEQAHGGKSPHWAQPSRGHHQQERAGNYLCLN